MLNLRLGPPGVKYSCDCFKRFAVMHMKILTCLCNCIVWGQICPVTFIDVHGCEVLTFHDGREPNSKLEYLLVILCFLPFFLIDWSYLSCKQCSMQWVAPATSSPVTQTILTQASQTMTCSPMDLEILPWTPVWALSRLTCKNYWPSTKEESLFNRNPGFSFQGKSLLHLPPPLPHCWHIQPTSLCPAQTLSIHQVTFFMAAITWCLH